jgi:murein DD-endopeptidase MepM/ murein hydrolase activator NlpD
MYAHLARDFVKRGEIVTARQIIGRAGCTGSCTGTHLHFQAWRDGKLTDPLELLGRDVFDHL